MRGGGGERGVRPSLGCDDHACCRRSSSNRSGNNRSTRRRSGGAAVWEGKEAPPRPWEPVAAATQSAVEGKGVATSGALAVPPVSRMELSHMVAQLVLEVESHATDVAGVQDALQVHRLIVLDRSDPRVVHLLTAVRWTEDHLLPFSSLPHVDQGAEGFLRGTESRACFCSCCCFWR